MSEANTKTFEDNKRLTVVNLLAGPGCGKSVLSAQLFAGMSIAGYKVELVHEWAKHEGVWEQRTNIFTEQDFITSNQHRLIRRLVNHDVDYAVVDSSLLLAGIYAPSWFPSSFFPFILDQYYTYDNINIVLERNPELTQKQTGRNEDFVNALKKDAEIVALLERYNIPYHTVKVGPNAYDDAMSIIRDHYVCKYLCK